MNEALSPAQILRALGQRFKEYRLRLDMTQRQVSEQTTVSIPTIYKFEAGRITDMSVATLFKLLRCVGADTNWDELLPDLPESPYLYNGDNKKQRIRHSKK